MKTPLARALAVALLVTAAFVTAARADEPYAGYRVTSTRLLKGKGASWDYVTMDAAGRRVFLARRANGVTVLDADSGEPVAELPDSKANGVAVATDLGRAFTSNGPTKDVTVVDLATLKPAGRIDIGEEPDGIFYDAATKTVFAVTADAGSLTLIDAEKLAPAGSIPLGSEKPEFVALDGAGHAYVALQDKNAVVAVDLEAKKVTATWPTAGCEQPTAMLYEPASRRVLVGCRGAKPVLDVLDPETGKVTATLPIGLGVDAVMFDARQKLVLTANGGSATLSVVKQAGPDEYVPVETVGTRPMARTGALDPATGKVFLVAGQYTQPAAAPGGKLPPYRVFPDTYEVLVLQHVAG